MSTSKLEEYQAIWEEEQRSGEDDDSSRFSHFSQGETRIPQPLYRAIPPPEPYPIDALGDFLAPVARAIQEVTQASEAICAQSVLGAAALAVQGFANVELPTGQTRPLVALPAHDCPQR